MDKAQFERELLALQDDLMGMAIFEESPTVNLLDLPLELLWTIMEPLDGTDLIYLSRAHQKFFNAIKYVKNKRFDNIRCVTTANSVPDRIELTPQSAKIFLFRAHVDTLILDTETYTLDVEGLTVRNLQMAGVFSADKAAVAIEKLKPQIADMRSEITSRYDEIMTESLGRALASTPTIYLRYVQLELYDYITGWTFVRFQCDLNNVGGTLPARFCEAITTLIDQFYAGTRMMFELHIAFRYAIDVSANLEAFGPRNPMVPTTRNESPQLPGRGPAFELSSLWLHIGQGGTIPAPFIP